MSSNLNNNLSECSHYKNGCSLFTACCKCWYKCKICHNEKNSHRIEPKNIKKIQCMYCSKQQKPSKCCSDKKCDKIFGKYFCDKCIVYENNILNDSMFHCAKCNMCFYGSSDIFIHCQKCNYCYNRNIEHICMENKIDNKCGICLENMKGLKKKITILCCGHAIHEECINEYIHNIIHISENYKVYCPLCRIVILDTKNYDNFYNNEKINKIYTNDTDINKLSYIDVMEMEIANERQDIRLQNTYNNI